MPQRWPDSPPRIWAEALPEAEQAKARNIESSLYGLRRHLDQFVHALTLLNFAGSEWQRLEKEPGWDRKRDDLACTASGWMTIAARDGAMTISHFAASMEAVKRALHRCPTLMPMVEASHFRTANRLFLARFRDFKEVRHSVAHSADLTKDRQTWERHATRHAYEGPPGGINIGEGARGMVQDSLQGRLFTTTYQGRVVTYELSDESALHLREVEQEFYKPFHETEKLTREVAMEVLHRPKDPPGDGG